MLEADIQWDDDVVSCGTKRIWFCAFGRTF